MRLLLAELRGRCPESGAISRAVLRRSRGRSRTFDRQQDDARVVVGDHVGVAVFGFVHFQVGVLPGELLAGVNGLQELGRKTQE